VTVSGEGDAAGFDPAAEPTDEELLEAAAGGEQGFEPADPTEEVDLALLVIERDEYRDTLLRVKAEFDNHRKRVAREEIDLRERANENLAEKLLVVLDACEAAIGHGSEDIGPIAKMLSEVLEREGLVRLAPTDEPFDPNLHDAVMHEEGDGGDPIVIETLRTGYQWKSRVLRPAMVKVKG
jgi:molecular chaperone GrpE